MERFQPRSGRQSLLLLTRGAGATRARHERVGCSQPLALLRDRRSSLLLTREPEPAALVQDEPGCYHFRVLDPRVFAILSATLAAVTIGHCYYI